MSHNIKQLQKYTIVLFRLDFKRTQYNIYLSLTLI